jgi:hypothetical protein
MFLPVHSHFTYYVYSDARSKLPIAGFAGSSDEKTDTGQFQRSQVHLPAFRQVINFFNSIHI